jgi:hypothetical protein
MASDSIVLEQDEPSGSTSSQVLSVCRGVGRWQEWNGTANGSWEHDECSLARGLAVLVGPFPRSFETVAGVDMRLI